MNNLFHKDVYYIYQIVQGADGHLFLFLFCCGILFETLAWYMKC